MERQSRFVFDIFEAFVQNRNDSTRSAFVSQSYSIHLWFVISESGFLISDSFLVGLRIPSLINFHKLFLNLNWFSGFLSFNRRMGIIWKHCHSIRNFIFFSVLLFCLLCKVRNAIVNKLSAKLRLVEQLSVLRNNKVEELQAVCLFWVPNTKIVFDFKAKSSYYLYFLIKSGSKRGVIAWLSNEYFYSKMYS